METYDGPKDFQHRQAARLHIVLLKNLGEPVPKRLELIAAGEQFTTTAIQELFEKIQDCGAYKLEYMIETDLLDADLAELWAWWLKHELRYATRGEK